MPAASNPSKARKGLDLSKQGIREQVYSILRDRMHQGEISPEERLVDQDIAAELNVSRMPVREALLQLKNEGYLEGTSRGFILPQFTPEDIANIFEIRLLLEPAAAAGACRNATVEGLGKMKQAVDEAERAHRKGDVLPYMQSNSAFRTAWVDMLANRQLAQIMDRLRDHAQAIRLATLRQKEFRAQSLQHTKEILDAFLRKDADAVTERVAHNLRMSAASYYAKQESLLQSRSGAAQAPVRGAARKRA